jgi:hypothetical protein
MVVAVIFIDKIVKMDYQKHWVPSNIGFSIRKKLLEDIFGWY